MKILNRFRTMVHDEAQHLEGFATLLMKRRNGEPWTPGDKVALRSHLKALGNSLPLIGLLALPGGLLLLPLLAILVDRRSRRRLSAELKPDAAPQCKGDRSGEKLGAGI